MSGGLDPIRASPIARFATAIARFPHHPLPAVQSSRVQSHRSNSNSGDLAPVGSSKMSGEEEENAAELKIGEGSLSLSSCSPHYPPLAARVSPLFRLAGRRVALSSPSWCERN